MVASRSTCRRKQVGAVLTRANYLLSTGYGGSVRGQPQCDEVGCDIDPNTHGCVRTVHAEVNTVLQAARHGVSTEGSVLYCTLSPCAACFKLLANAGVLRVVYAEEYRVPPDREFARVCGVVLEHHPWPEMIQVQESEMRRLLQERERLYAQVTELQDNGTKLILALRAKGVGSDGKA